MNIHKHFIETENHVSLYEDTILTRRFPILIYGFPASAEYTKLINSTFTVDNIPVTIYEKRNEKDVRTHIGFIIPRYFSSVSKCIRAAEQCYHPNYTKFLKNHSIAEQPEFYTSTTLLKRNDDGTTYREYPHLITVGIQQNQW
jgi:hypothetical protein